MPSFAQFRSKPLWWWLQTPLYARRAIKAGLRKRWPDRFSTDPETPVAALVYRHFFRAQRSGVCVEVGAARPDFLSIGAVFRGYGWRVIAVEPNPAFCEMQRAQGAEVLQFACGPADADDIEFSVVHSRENGEITNESLSSLGVKPGYAALHPNFEPDQDVEIIRVAVRRLDSLLQDYAPNVSQVDCLAIDTEGWELEVLQGFDLERFSPRVVILENLLDADSYRDYMTGRGYRLWRRLPPNEIYERRKGQ